MRKKQIRPGLWQITALEEQLRVFRTVSFTEAGMMYQSYLLDTGSDTILLGTLPAPYAADWLAEVKAIVGSGKVSWAVLLGTDGDREAANLLLQAYPETVLIGGTSTLFSLQDVPFRKIEIRTDRSLVLGGKRLEFHVLGNALYVLDRKNGVLWTADAFGSAYAAQVSLVSELPDPAAYLRGAARYFADISGPARRKTMESAAALVGENSVGLICPACGPAADADLEELLSLYTADLPEPPKILTLALVYAPGGYVRELADQIAAGIRESGPVAVEVYDLSAVNRDQVIQALPGADAWLFGTTEQGGDAAKAVWDIVTSLGPRDGKSKLAAVFCSTNSKGNAAENLRQRLAMLGCDLHLQDYIVQGRPDVQTLKNAGDYGFGVGCSLQRIPNPRKPKLVKCLVCGEIFDASLGTCPVCGVGLEQCVPVDEEAASFRKDSDRRYVILGGGVAAVSAADAIRQRDGTGTITMVSAEDYLPINRPMLTKDLQAAAQRAETLFVHGPDWYAERNIDLRLGCKAVSLDLEQQCVTTDSGETLSYDRLIYATGAECFIPPFAGHDKPCVLTIRHLTDNEKLAEMMQTAKNAVVIGGGVLGLEAASGLMRAGIQVTVLEATPQIIGRQVDAGTAAILKQTMEAMHVACYEGVSIAAIEGEERAAGVRLADGRVFPADFVIVSCGNRANVQAAKAAGIEVERSIVVNQFMETSAPNVYACGDCAQFDGVNYQLWQEASNQGRVAGANAAGDRLTYANRPLGLSLEGFGTSLFAMGDPGKKDGVPYRTVETQDQVRNRHEKYWFFGGSLQGAVLIGAPGKVAAISQAVTEHARYDELF